MRVRPLPGITELGRGAVFVLGEEDGVVAETFATARLVTDATVEGSGATQLVALVGDGDQFADVTGAAAFTFAPRSLRAYRRSP